MCTAVAHHNVLEASDKVGKGDNSTETVEQLDKLFSWTNQFLKPLQVVAASKLKMMTFCGSCD